jgi:hypothetical protein
VKDLTNEDNQRDFSSLNQSEIEVQLADEKQNPSQTQKKAEE